MSESSKTLECMVCGKTFSRGPVDLARHQNAVTLKHLVSTTASAQFSFRCRKCNIHFTSKEHLSLHRAQSSCGQPLSKPVPVTSTSAIIRPKPVKPLPIIINQAEESNIPPVLPHSSRGTPRHAASVATAAIAALSGIGHTKEKVPIPATPAQVSECGPLVTEKESNEGSAEVLGTRHSTRTRHPNPLVSPEGVYTSKPATPSSAAPQVTQSSSSANKETATTEAKSRRGRPPAAATQVPVAASIPPVSDTQKTRKKAMTIDELAEFQRTNKRQRVIIPEGLFKSKSLLIFIFATF